jgi:hypothetical protein
MARHVPGDMQFSRQRANWVALSLWAKEHTPLDEGFLLPTERLYPGSPLPETPPRFATLMIGDEVFEPLSHRGSWVSVKAGAAAMWIRAPNSCDSG